MTDCKSTGDSSKQVKRGNIHEEFKEAKEVNGIIDSLVNIYKNDIAVEMAVERFQFIVDEYQEQPHLLDPHLEGLLTQLLDIARDEKSPDPVVHLAFKLMYLITKTRGYKVIVRLLPHEVADVEPVLALLAKQSPSDHQAWETRYILLLWLSMVCMIPFDMVKLDSNARDESGVMRKPVMERIIEAGQLYVDVSDKSRDAAAYMLSRFMTRPDVKKQKLPEFLDWALMRLKSANKTTMTGMIAMSGVLNTIALLYKQGKREDLVPYAAVILKMMADLELSESSNTLLRKLCTKLTQRIGLAFLKAKIAAWRYQRGSRSLADNIALNDAQDKNMEWKSALEVEEDYDIPDEIEDVIEMMLGSLRDKDTVVRWSAAKGIGRLTGRLPRELADEVVGSVMELFSISETDGAWHGGCLSLAELGRRGLLLPDRLPDVVPVIIRALHYDEKRGNFSVGAHVRDAACYVIWAFARAYDPKEIAPHVTRIATALILVSVFDREVNVRRAAAAAFQEHVGRQGQFPHGIDILTTCDYFAVGNRNNCYLELSVFVAQYPEYVTSMIDHLVDIKIGHWDGSVRELSAQALHNLTCKAPEYMAEQIVPKLLENTESIDVNLRHGSILSLAEVIQALCEHQQTSDKKVTDILKPDIIEKVKNIAERLQKAQLYKGYGGELMRKSVCSLVDKASRSHMPYHGDAIIGLWQDLIDECLMHNELDVQMAAVAAIPAFFTEYYQQPDGSAQPIVQETFIEKYCKKLHDPAQSIRMGYALALGAFPRFFLHGKLKVVLGALMQLSRITEKDKKMAEARRDAIKAINSICQTVGVQPGGNANDTVCEENLDALYNTLFEALKDYTLDSRGDVGAWVREAAMSGLQELSSLIVKNAPALFQPDISRVMFCSIVQQCVEKIDRTRAHAGEVFSALLYHEPPIPSVPNREVLTELFPKKDCEKLNWAAPSDTFQRFTGLLKEPAYTYNVLLGITVSVGGLTESLVKHSAHALLIYLRQIKKDKELVTAFASVLIQVFKDNIKVDRVTLPMFKMLDQLISNNIFDLITADPQNTFITELYDVCKTEVTKCGDIQKLLASIDVFCGLLQFEGETRTKILTQLAIFMCHRFPIVRKNSAGKLFEAMIMFEDIVEEEHLEQVNCLLSETQWDHPVNEIRPIRNQLCDLLGIKTPVALKKADGEKK